MCVCVCGGGGSLRKKEVFIVSGRKGIHHPTLPQTLRTRAYYLQQLLLNT